MLARGSARDFHPGLAFMRAVALQRRSAHGEASAGAISNVAFQGAGFYESTGTDVAVRSKPEVSNPWGANVLGTLQIGDAVKASGLTQTGGGIEFAEVSSVFDVQGKPSWVATMYLKPSSKTAISGGAAPIGQPQDQPQAEPAKLAEESIPGGGWGIAIMLVLLAVAIYFLAK